MRIRPLTYVFALCGTIVVQANEPSEPIDRMPILGNRIPELEQRVRDLEQRLRAAEQANGEGKAPAATSVAPSECSLKAELGRADALQKSGDFAGAFKAYHGALQETVARLAATSQALTDCYLASYSAAMAVETLEAKGERALAKALCEETLKGLRRCRETMPEWNPKIVEYRLKKVEERFAKLQ